MTRKKLLVFMMIFIISISFLGFYAYGDKIKTIKLVYTTQLTVIQGEAYKIPDKVKVKMSDGTNKLMNVKWNLKSLNIEEEGEYSIYGIINGYKGKALLKVNVIGPKENIQPVKNDKDMYEIIKKAVELGSAQIQLDLSNSIKEKYKISRNVYSVFNQILKENPNLRYAAIKKINSDKTPYSIQFRYFYAVRNDFYEDRYGLNIRMDKIVLKEGENIKISITKKGKSIDWKNVSLSTGQGVIKVDNKGNVKAVKSGEDSIYIKYFDSYIEIEMKVIPKDTIVIHCEQELKNFIIDEIKKNKDNEEIYSDDGLSIPIFIDYKEYKPFDEDGLVKMMRDNIEYNKLSPIYSCSINDDMLGIKIKSRYKKDEIQEINQKVDKVLKEIIKPEMNDMQKLLAIHDYVVLNISYDYNALDVLEGNSTDLENNKDFKEKLYLYQSFVKGKGMCQGYSDTMTLLLNTAGIPCETVFGYGGDISKQGGIEMPDGSVEKEENHAWNLVKLNGDYFYVDATWDDPSDKGDKTKEGILTHSYFCLSYNEIMFDHSLDMNLYPAGKAQGKKLSYEDEGLAAEDDNYYYLSYYPKVIKINKKDSSDNSVINEDGAVYLNVCDGWLYYINTKDLDNIYKIKTDGTQNTRILESKGICSYLSVADKYMYYIINNELYRAELDGSNAKKLFNDKVLGYKIYNNVLYFEKMASFIVDNGGQICEINLSNGEVSTVIDDIAGEYIMENDWIYYVNLNDGHKVYKIKTDGTEKTKLSDEKSSQIQVFDGYVYYISDGKTYRINSDGTGKIKLN